MAMSFEWDPHVSWRLCLPNEVKQSGSLAPVTLRAMSASTMKKGTDRPRKKGTTRARRVNRDDILPEYDFSHAKRNPYAVRYTVAANVVELDPDVAAVFPNAEAVNHALRALGRIIQEHAPKGRRQAPKTGTVRSAPP